MILVNNSSYVKYKVVDASARFFVLECISFPEDTDDYLGKLVCITPVEFMQSFLLEGDLLC